MHLFPSRPCLEEEIWMIPSKASLNPIKNLINLKIFQLQGFSKSGGSFEMNKTAGTNTPGEHVGQQQY